MLQRSNPNVCKPFKNSSECCPSKQVPTAAMTSASDEKWRPFNCFFQSGRAKDLSAFLYFWLSTSVNDHKQRTVSCPRHRPLSRSTAKSTLTNCKYLSTTKQLRHHFHIIRPDVLLEQPEICCCKYNHNYDATSIYEIFILNSCSPRCNNCVFYSQWLFSTCFGWQSHPSSGVQCCIWPQVSWLS